MSRSDAVWWRGWGALLAALAAARWEPACAEDPSGKNPTLPLAVRSHPEVEALVAEAQKLTETIQKDLATYTETRVAKRFSKLDPRVIGGTIVNAIKLQRYASILEIWGETAGVDYRLRAARFQGDLTNFIMAFKNEAGAVERLRRTELPLANSKAAGYAKDLVRVSQLFSQGKEIEAEGILLAWFDDLEKYLCWFEDVDRNAVLKPFQRAKDAVLPKAVTLRKEIIAGKLAEARRQVSPPFAELLAEARAAAESVRTTGKGTIGGKSLAGPEVVAQLGEKWRGTQALAIRCRALDWARGISPGSPGQKDHDALVEAQRAFAAEMPKAIAAVVAADAMRATVPEAPSLYAAYVEALAPLVVAGSGLELEKLWEPALAALAGKSPALAEDVASYRRATSETLRWRKLAAESRTRALAKEYLPAPALVAPAVKADAAFAGLLPAQATSPDGAKLRWCVPEVLKWSQSRLAGKKAAVADWVRVTPARGAVESRPVSRVYAQATLPAQAMQEDVLALKRDLLAENQPPLTLAAAAALYEAENGFAAQVGLEISDLALVSVIDRQASLAAADAPWLTLGPLPLENPKLVEPADLYLRLEGTPKWVRFSTFCWEGK